MTSRAGLVLLIAALILVPSTATAQDLAITGATLVDGRADLVSPFAVLGNLEGVGAVAGRTLLVRNGVLFPETRVTFVWLDGTGMIVSDLSDAQYFDGHTQVPTGVSPGGTTVGWAFYRDRIDQQPFALEPGRGFTFLPVPRTPGGPPGAHTPFQGFAYGVSDDGLQAVGTVQEGPFGDVPTMAALWTSVARGARPRWILELLATAGSSSNAWAISGDGSTIVGDAGPDRASLQAARWIHGVPQALDAVGTSSTVRLSSADGSIAAGWADVGGVNALVTWDAAGSAAVHVPPGGARIESLHAITPDGAAVAGVLSVDLPTSTTGEDWSPFVWSAAAGFVVIPEAGMATEYNISRALDLTDDGDLVVGELRSTNPSGLPAALGFVWTRGGGLLLVNDLLAASGLASPTYVSSAYAVSGDGLRLLATGDARPTTSDTDAVILDLIRN